MIILLFPFLRSRSYRTGYMRGIQVSENYWTARIEQPKYRWSKALGKKLYP